MQRWHNLASTNLSSEAGAVGGGGPPASGQPAGAAAGQAGLFQLRPSASSGHLGATNDRKSFNYQSSDNQSSYVSSNVFAVSDMKN